MTTPWVTDPSLQPLKLRVFELTLTKDEMDDMLATLSPAQELLLDVLVARERLGESLWTFDRRQAKPLAELERRGLVTVMHGIVEKTVRASLTDVARKILFHPAYDAGALTPEIAVRGRRLDGQINFFMVVDQFNKPWTPETARQEAASWAGQYLAVDVVERRVSQWRPLDSTT